MKITPQQSTFGNAAELVERKRTINLPHVSGMRYCLNPLCQNPQNSDQANFCQTCGFKLVLGDRYYAIHPIGQGSFGRTFLAIDDYKPSKPRCVIKQSFPLARSHVTPEKAAQLFQQEAIRLEELGQHPQIPELLAYFQQDGYQYLVQEFIDGWTLDRELKENGVFSSDQIWQVLNDLLPVLQFVHDHQVIHRDIKPANIIRRHRDRLLVLVDFGAAKCTTNVDLLVTGTSIGSPAFAAPEQAMGKATFASDLYSLGVTCIYLLTQVKPAKLFNPEEGTWVWRPHLQAAIDPRLGQVLDRLLESPTKTRYHAAIEALQDLPVIACTLPQSAELTNPPISSPPLSSPPVASSTWSGIPTVHSRPLTAELPWKNVQTLTGHTHWVRSVAFSPNNRFIVSGSGDRTVRLWNLADYQLHYTLTGHNHWVRSVAVNGSSQLIASGSNDRSVKIWRLNTGELLHTLVGHNDWVRSVAFSPNHKWVVSGSQDKTVRIWQLGTGELIQTLKGHDHWVLAIATAPAPTTLHPQQPWLLASASRDQTIRLWNLKTATPFCTLSGHLDAVNAIAFSPDGQHLISGSQDGTIKIWQVEAGELSYTLTDHTAAITTVAVSANGELLISGSQDRTVRIWQLATGRLLQTLTDPDAWVWSVAISPDSAAIVAACGDGNLNIWRRA